MPRQVAKGVLPSGALTDSKVREGASMRTKLLVPVIFFWTSFGGSHLAAQNPLATERQEPARPSASTRPDASTARKDAAPEQGAPSRLEEVIDRMIARE